MTRTFEEQIGFHLDDLYSAALCFTLDEHRAEELIQEASVRAFHEFPAARAHVDFGRAMLEVLVSTYLQRQRRKGRDPLAGEVDPLETMLTDVSHSTYIEPFPEPGTPAYTLLSDWMFRVWHELDDGDRLILWLADVERLRHQQVAKMTGISLEHARSRHYAARRRMSQAAARYLKPRKAGTAQA